MIDTPRRTVPLHMLDALRGLAALYVMLGHARWLLWSGNAEFMQTGQHGVGLVLAVLSSGVRYGHQAVLFFFLLSGFCIHYRQSKQLGQAGSPEAMNAVRRFDIPGYGWRRLRRLLPPVLVALALTFLLDDLGSHINPSFYAGQTAYALINANLGNQSRSLATLLGNLAFQATFLVPSFGTDGPLWSLSFEFWFYVMYPVALLVSAQLGARGLVALAATVCGLSLTGQAAWLPGWTQAVLCYWIVWIVGAVIAEAYVGRIRVRGLDWLAPVALVGLAGLALGYPRGVSDTLDDLLWGAVLAVLFGYFMLAAPAPIAAWVETGGGWLGPVGAISFSLYVVHFPWLAFLSAWWLSAHQRLPLGAELVIPGVASTLVLAAGCWFMVERHFVGESRERRPIHGLLPRARTPGRAETTSP